MSELDYDPLQKEIYKALSMSDRTQKALEEIAPLIMCSVHRRLIGDLQSRLRRRNFFGREHLNDLRVLIDHLDEQIEDGERLELIADEHCADGGYTQIVYTEHAQELRSRATTLRTIYAHLAAVDNIRMAERLALEMRAAG